MLKKQFIFSCVLHSVGLNIVNAALTISESVTGLLLVIPVSDTKQ